MRNDAKFAFANATTVEIRRTTADANYKRSSTAARLSRSANDAGPGTPGVVWRTWDRDPDKPADKHAFLGEEAITAFER